MKATINYGFDAELSVGETGLSFLRDVHGVPGVYAKSEAIAKKKLKAALGDVLKQAFAFYDNRWNRAVIGTGDGSVIIVAHNSFNFEYRIHGPDRKNGATTIGDWKTLDEALIAARKHAGEFGGIVWENR